MVWLSVKDCLMRRWRWVIGGVAVVAFIVVVFSGASVESCYEKALNFSAEMRANSQLYASGRLSYAEDRRQMILLLHDAWMETASLPAHEAAVWREKIKRLGDFLYEEPQF